MPKRLSYQEVYDFIKSKGDELISKEYINSNKLLEIKCGLCNKLYKQVFRIFREGRYHPYCQNEEKKPFRGYIRPIILVPIILVPILCIVCNKEFKPKNYKIKMCSLECSKKYVEIIRISRNC